jgi:hypothetical protein
MKLKALALLGLLLGSLSLCLIGYAQQRSRLVRQAPPPFQAHPPGVHPHGPVVRQHPVRVLAPRAVSHGRSGWTHWDHPEFSRPTYYWNWGGVHTVTCIAEDSYGATCPHV